VFSHQANIIMAYLKQDSLMNSYSYLSLLDYKTCGCNLIEFRNLCYSNKKYNLMV
jgi:hypothetical protein